MRLYHGTNRKFDEYRTPTCRDILDVTVGGVVYMTSDINVARKYAGQKGHVLSVSVVADGKNVVSYADQRKKQNLAKKARKYVRDVYVCTPSFLNSLQWKWI